MEITKKIHRLGYRFSMVFFLEIANIWQKSQDFWLADFFLEIFKIHKLVWIFCCFKCVSSMFCLKLLLILNFTNAVLSKTTFRNILYHGWCLVRQRNRLARPYGLKNLLPRKKPTTLWVDNWQSLETSTKIISVISASEIDVERETRVFMKEFDNRILKSDSTDPSTAYADKKNNGNM